MADIRKPYFGISNSLLPHDFQAASSMSASNLIVWQWDDIWLKSAAIPYINLTGLTQFRVRLQQADNNNNQADYIAYYSGDAQTKVRPKMVIYFFVP